MDNLWQDIRYALRRLRKSPGFTFVAVLTLALGIGANTAIFSVVNAVLLQPLPFRDPGRLVLLSERTPAFPILSVSWQNYKDWRDQSHSFEAVGAVRNTLMTLTSDAEPERLPVQMASANLFSMLGVSPALGRAFAPSEDQPGAAGVAMISYSLWQRRFAGSPQIIGQAVTLDNKPYNVVGVLPPGLEILQQSPDIIVPIEPWAKTLPDDRSWHPGILPIARLKPGVSLEQARAEMTVIAKRLEQQYPVFDTGTGAIVNVMQEQMVQNVRPALLVLLGAVGFVLLIACTNVANLLLARAAARQREIAIRVALGASRLRVTRQLLTESVLLSLAGAAIGLLLAGLAIPPLLSLAGTSIPGAKSANVDLRVLGFTTIVAVVAGILFGLAPALHTARSDVREALNQTDRGAVGGAALRMRGLLVTAEVAVAMLLLVGAGLLIRSFSRLSNVAPGFQTESLLIADVPLSPTAHRDAAERMAFFDRVLERLRALPGVKAVGATSLLPASGSGSIIHFNIQGHPPKTPHEYVLTNYRVVSPGYLQTLGTPLVQGRWLTDADRDGAPAVVVINQTMARTFFPNESPLGKHLQLGATPENDVPWMEVVGVVGDMKQTLSSEAPTEMYVPYRQGNLVLPVFVLEYVLRTSGDPLALSSGVRGAIHELDRNQPVVKIRSMEQNIATTIAAPRFRTLLLTIFAAIALVLAAVGIYGVMAYSVAQRTREIGIRMALGSPSASVFRLILGNGLKVTIAGIVVGIAAAAALTRYLSTMLYAVRPTDPLTLLGTAFLLVAVAMLACYLPARRATRVDPMLALRHE